MCTPELTDEDYESLERNLEADKGSITPEKTIETIPDRRNISSEPFSTNRFNQCSLNVISSHLDGVRTTHKCITTLHNVYVRLISKLLRTYIDCFTVTSGECEYSE